ncbi:MAG: class I SAM-dependent RNA methyltransferase [Verrucomicrobiia bacterium]
MPMTEATLTTVSPGQRLSALIEDVAFGGEGVARANDLVIFIPFVIPGERVELEIVELKKRFARARLVKVIEPSPQRVEPRCPYFGECGGCQYQHIDYATQLTIKHKQVTDLFERIGGCAGARIDPVEACPAPYGYRNRIMVRTQWDKFKQRLNLGFIRYDNRLVVDIDQCPISEPAINAQLQEVRAHPPPKGGLKVVLRVQPEGWEVHPDSFFQNNFHLLPRMVEVIRARIQSSGVRHLIDAYCGVGFFSLELAGDVDSFVGIEFDHRAIHAARRNAASRNRTNGEFIAGLTEVLLPDILTRFPAGQTAVILDPPRRGCLKESVELLRSSGVAQILYVSCHPATLARDIGILTETGQYRLRQVTPLDMFPQTQHVECVADLGSAG